MPCVTRCARSTARSPTTRTDANPWAAMRAAVDRRTAGGVVLGEDERLSPRALVGFLTAPNDPGGTPRRVAVGAPADLCVLDAPLRNVLVRLDAGDVATTIIDGHIRWRRDRGRPAPAAGR